MARGSIKTKKLSKTIYFENNYCIFAAVIGSPDVEINRESGENPEQNPAERHLPVAFPAAVSRPLRGANMYVTEFFGKTFAARR